MASLALTLLMAPEAWSMRGLSHPRAPQSIAADNVGSIYKSFAGIRKYVLQGIRERLKNFPKDNRGLMAPAKRLHEMLTSRQAELKEFRMPTDGELETQAWKMSRRSMGKRTIEQLRLLGRFPEVASEISSLSWVIEYHLASQTEMVTRAGAAHELWNPEHLPVLRARVQDIWAKSGLNGEDFSRFISAVEATQMASASSPLVGETRITEYVNLIERLFGPSWRDHEAELIQMIDDTEDAIYSPFEHRNPVRRN